MVDASKHDSFCRKLASIENLQRIKSLAFSADFRRIKFNANTCDLSTAVIGDDDCANSNRNGIKKD
jgi:hypothetical protein